jgi:hypothetical protein
MEPDAAHKDWRELARLMQDEMDPDRILELARELIAAYDAECPQGKPRTDGKTAPPFGLGTNNPNAN